MPFSPNNSTPQQKIDTLLKSERQLHRIVGAFCTMDADVMFAMMEDVEICNNTTPDLFYDQLTELFNYCESKGDSYFKVYTAQCSNTECNSCSRRSFQFFADHTGNYIGLRFNLEGNKVQLFKECCSINSPLAKKPGSKMLYLSEDPF